MDKCYERLNDAFANWKGGEPSLEDRVDALESEMLQKQDVLTFDPAPTESSANPVTSGGVWTDQQRQETEIGVVANAGAKNLFDIQHPSMVRNTGYNATSDGGVELTCANAVWTQYVINDIPVTTGREYVFTLYVDEISGTDALRIYVRELNGSGSLLYDSNNISTVKTLTATITPSTDKIWVGIYLNNSAAPKTASAKIRAMLRPASITDNTFVPYAPTNRELYEMILALQNGG